MIKCAKLYIRGIPVGEERETGIENVFEEIMAENFPNLRKETDIQVEEAQRVPNEINIIIICHQYIIKMTKVKDNEGYKGSKRKTKS